MIIENDRLSYGGSWVTEKRGHITITRLVFPTLLQHLYISEGYIIFIDGRVEYEPFKFQISLFFDKIWGF